MEWASDLSSMTTSPHRGGEKENKLKGENNVWLHPNANDLLGEVEPVLRSVGSENGAVVLRMVLERVIGGWRSKCD